MRVCMYVVVVLLTFKYLSLSTWKIALHTFGIINDIVDSCILDAYINDRNESPVARNRKVNSNLNM